MKFIKIVVAGFFMLMTQTVRADEGMWLPQLLSKLNEDRMKSLGMKISAADIYSINKGSLKDAVVSFGGFCTADVISTKGLLLTNHHCGFDAIQNHSSIEKNYIRDGFWAKDYGQEIPNSGLFVTFIVRIDDVSAAALNGITSVMNERERQAMIDKNLQAVRATVKKEEGQDVFTRGFFEGNQYYLFVTETFRDIRLVGAPPSSIGKFGQDTDNWVWPRHTGDFSMFRIYASKNNTAANYSPDNVPYKPKRSLNISLDGIAQGDFSMVFGFPGRTTQYLHSAAVEQIRTVNDPAKIAIRDKALNIIDGFMRKDEQINIQYASKYASIQNAYKKWQGEVLGLTRTNAVGKKQAYESEFQKRVEANAAMNAKYGTLLSDLGKQYAAFEPYGLARDFYTEIVSKIEILGMASQLNALIAAYEREGEKGYEERLKSVQPNLLGSLGEYSAVVDKKLFEALMLMYATGQPAKNISPILTTWLTAAGNDYELLTQEIFSQGDLYDEAALTKMMKQSPADAVKQMKAFRAVRLIADMQETYQEKVQAPSAEIQQSLATLQRNYMQAQLEVMTDKKFYPDANSTLRVGYGKVDGYTARDAVKYNFQTHLDGVMQKYIPDDYEFDVPEKLRTLYAKKDYGVYGENGRMPVNYIATNHTTGGNSGSPALDAYGNLVGLNFDRAWEGTMSDINYDASICRNIMVDIRYVLFIVDKFADAGHLIKEINLVHSKKKSK